MIARRRRSFAREPSPPALSHIALCWPSLAARQAAPPEPFMLSTSRASSSWRISPLPPDHRPLSSRSVQTSSAPALRLCTSRGARRLRRRARPHRPHHRFSRASHPAPRSRIPLLAGVVHTIFQGLVFSVILPCHFLKVDMLGLIITGDSLLLASTALSFAPSPPSCLSCHALGPPSSLCLTSPRFDPP